MGGEAGTPPAKVAAIEADAGYSLQGGAVGGRCSGLG